MVETLLKEGVEDEADVIKFKFKDFVSTRLRRFKETHALRGTIPVVDSLHETVLLGETSLTLLILTDTGDEDGALDRNDLRAWFGEEQLPDGWTGIRSGGRRIDFWDMNRINKKLKAAVQDGIDCKNAVRVGEKDDS